jgi:hypothetical protein
MSGRLIVFASLSKYFGTTPGSTGDERDQIVQIRTTYKTILGVW